MPAPHTGQAVVTVASASSAAPIPSGSYAHQFRNSAAPRVRRCGPSVRLSPAARVIAPSSSRSIPAVGPEVDEDRVGRRTRDRQGRGDRRRRDRPPAGEKQRNAVSRTAPAGPSLITSRRPDLATARLGNYVVDLLWFDDCRNHEDVPCRADESIVSPEPEQIVLGIDRLAGRAILALTDCQARYISSLFGRRSVEEIDHGEHGRDEGRL